MEREITDSFADWLAYSTDDDYTERKISSTLQRDTRINKIRFSEPDKQFQEYIDWTKSDTYKNVNRAKYLLSDKWETNNEDLKSAMQKHYSLSNQEYDQVLQSLANDRSVNVRRNNYNKKI